MGGERDFTRWLAGFFAPPKGRGALGIGDDAAVVENRGRHSVVACDPVIEGVHFTSGTPLHLVGRKAVNRNLADLAAMGATLDYVVVSVLWPSTSPARGLVRLMRGVRDAVESQGGCVVGGDTGSTRGPLTVTITVLGHLVARALRRDGARAHDAIHVTAPLGGSILGHHLRFVPPLAAGVQLARSAQVSAAIDVSDGLALDLRTLLLASSRACGISLHAVLDAAAVPVSRAAHRLARRSGKTPLEHALTDGEDHALLFTTRGKPPAALCRSWPSTRVALGVVRPGSRRDLAAVFVNSPHAGRVRVLGGYQHVLGPEGSGA